MESPNEEKLMSVPEAGRMLGVGRGRAWQYVDQGRLPAVRVGQRTWCVRFSDVQAMGDRRRRERKSEP